MDFERVLMNISYRSHERSDWFLELSPECQRGALSGISHPIETRRPIDIRAWPETSGACLSLPITCFADDRRADCDRPRFAHPKYSGQACLYRNRRDTNDFETAKDAGSRCHSALAPGPNRNPPSLARDAPDHEWFGSPAIPVFQNVTADNLAR